VFATGSAASDLSTPQTIVSGTSAIMAARGVRACHPA
jgi:hypothetical protein